MCEPTAASGYATSGPSRRDFLKTIGAGTIGLASTLPARARARISGANDTIRLGVIGVGRRGRSLTRALREEHPDAAVVALSDVYAPNLEYGAGLAPEADTYRDFRRVLDRSDVNAVVIATPDHWHALQTILACRAGKDVYVEKPASRTVEEGRAMVEAARTHERVVQVGTQQRSSPHFREAVQRIRDGELGAVSFVRAWNYANEYPTGIGVPSASEPPPGLDWDLWLGPAPWRSYAPNRFGVRLDQDGAYTRWATFRYFWDYGGGMMTDWGVHLLDVVQWALDESYPLQVSATGGKFYVEDDRETPDTLSATFRYPDFLCTYENRVCNGRPIDGRGYGIRFHGTRGTLTVDRSGYEIRPEEGASIEARTREAESENGHLRDFLDAMRSRRRPVSDAEVGHRSTSTCLLANLAYRTGSDLDWDGERESVVGDPVASRMLAYSYRKPWRI